MILRRDQAKLGTAAHVYDEAAGTFCQSPMRWGRLRLRAPAQSPKRERGVFVGRLGVFVGRLFA